MDRNLCNNKPRSGGPRITSDNGLQTGGGINERQSGNHACSLWEAATTNDDRCEVEVLGIGQGNESPRCKDCEVGKDEVDIPSSRALIWDDVDSSVDPELMRSGQSAMRATDIGGGASETENKEDFDEGYGNTNELTRDLGRPCYKLGDEGRLVWVDVYGQSLALLIDTGSQVSVVSQKAFDRLPAVELQPISIKLNAVNGSNFPVRGLVRLPMQIVRESEPLEEEFLVAELADSFEVDGILGMDIMKAHGVNIDLQRDVLTWGGEEICCLGMDSGGVLTHELEVEPGQSMVAFLTVPRNRPISKDGLVQPLPNAVQEAGLFIGRSLVDVRQDVVPVPILNASAVPIKLKPGQVLASVEPLQVVGNERKFCNAATSARVENMEAEPPGHLSELYKLSSADLKVEEKEKLKEVLFKFEHTFARDDDELGRTDIVKHRIDVGDSRPVKQVPRRQALETRQIEQAEVSRMLEQGIISPSSSPWASPTVLVTKKDGKTRFCVDFRELNKRTKKDAYPLPRVEDCLDNLGGAKWFCTLDLQAGYWQVDLDPADKEKTAFCTRAGLYEFNVLPFGLSNAPATFERLMEMVLQGLQWWECLIYLEDIIVFGSTFEETLDRLVRVFDRLSGAGLKLKPKKCVLFRKEVVFLGHVISQEGVSTQAEKVEAVRSWPIPKSKKEVRSFLGLVGYYRRFIMGFANIARPLTNATRLHEKFAWTAECQLAFDQLKQSLMTPLFLVTPGL